MLYTFILKNEKTKNYRLISQLLVFFNLLGFVLLLINNETRFAKNLLLLFSILTTAVYTFFTIVERISQKPMPDFWHRSIFALCALTWLKEGFWWLTIILLLIILLEILAHRKLIVEINEKKITVPYLTQKKMKWEEVDNVVLKDGLLTIDFKNNRLFQQPILILDREINEEEFNDFCLRQLNKNELYKYN
jgi:hypothetical protein